MWTAMPMLLVARKLQRLTERMPMGMQLKGMLTLMQMSRSDVSISATYSHSQRSL
jgi:hypothetical protein